MRSFDEDPSLRDLLDDGRQALLLGLMAEVSGVEFSLLEHPEPQAQPLEFNLETIAWLRCESEPARQEPAARLMEFVFHYIAKYRMAASLHHDTTEASFTELQRQHAALQESEERYRQLSEQLQQRVDEQVKVIESAQQQLYESARMRAIGQLAAGVAHEINNPIGYITSNLRVAGEYLDELNSELAPGSPVMAVLEDFRALLQESIGGAQRIASIVADLKTFSNIDQQDFVPCDLNHLIATACHLLEAESNHSLRVTQCLGSLPKLAGYPAKISQALYNVLDNAARAVQPLTGSVRVTSRQASEGSCEVIVEDNGCGIAPEHLERLFDPFFTTRPVGSGTGLGLTVARDILTAHRGTIGVRSEPGVGTRVTMRFLCH
ncbi:two-component sensor histidine kinase [Pseudomonas stutzeri]|uniref:ATP-binding protein n=1 Tax=Stutzerimonas stutzeri TaxID=316 RepID=UPI001909B46F|nr:two-component sensor histidine kinase [Stutzerimonas stutzeri]